jgi:hypothetical protein
MNTAHSRLSYSILIISLLTLASSLFAVDIPDFSGSYTLTGTRGELKCRKCSKGSSWTLRVEQSTSLIHVTRVMDGLENENSFPLDGTQGPYASPGQEAGTCSAHFKGRLLILDIYLMARPKSGGPEYKDHIRELWELSSHSRRLTIRTQMKFPDSTYKDVVEPWAEIYTRK